MIKDEEAKKQAQLKLQKKKNIRAFLTILSCYILIYLIGKLLSWDGSEMPLYPWFITMVSSKHSYLFGWLLSSDLFHYSMLFSSLIALGGWRRLSCSTLIGFATGLSLGEFLGGLESVVAPGYHYGWAIWGCIFLSSWAMGLWLQKIDHDELNLSSGKLRLWLLIYLLILIAVPILILSGIPGYARA